MSKVELTMQLIKEMVEWEGFMSEMYGRMFMSIHLYDHQQLTPEELAANLREIVQLKEEFEAKRKK